LFQSVCWGNFADVEEAKKCKTAKQGTQARRSKKIGQKEADHFIYDNELRIFLFQNTGSPGA
jgi:hypothetical protein